MVVKEILYKLSYNDLLLMKRIIDYWKEKNFYPDVKELGLKKSDIYHLIRLGVVEVAYETRQYFVIKVKDELKDYVYEVLQEKTKELSENDIDKVLNIEYLYVKPDLKEMIKKAIMKKVWLLIVGDVGTGKTEILKALNKLPRTVYFNGTLLKKDDLLQVYNDNFVEIILINEIDKCASHYVYDVLVEMHDEGRFSVIATANNTRKLIEPLRSRFIQYHLNYTIDEIFKIIELVLIHKYNYSVIDIDLVKRLYNETKDIRQVIEKYRILR